MVKELKPVFETLLKKGRRNFRRKLSTSSVSGFSNSRASNTLYNSYQDDINKALRWQSESLTFTFGINSKTPTQRRGDPAEYVAALDDAEKRGGGPSTARVRQWLYDRGILKPGQKRAVLSNGTTVSDKRLVYLVKRGIFRKTRYKTYKSLRISEMLSKVVDIGNAESDFRQSVRRKLTNVVLGTT
jgi:hypothetical protein